MLINVRKDVNKSASDKAEDIPMLKLALHMAIRDFNLLKHGEINGEEL